MQLMRAVDSAIQAIRDYEGLPDDINGHGYQFRRQAAHAGDSWTYEAHDLGDCVGILTVTQDSAQFTNYNTAVEDLPDVKHIIRLL